MHRARKPRFSLGQVVATPGALAAVDGAFVTKALALHSAGDWGVVAAEDAAANDDALTHGGRIVSAYVAPSGERVWVITEADRSSTCVLLPSEY